MGSDIEFVEAIRRIRERDDRFHEEAYRLTMRSLECIYLGTGQFRHVTARELIAALCMLSEEMYGPMAYTFLTDWGIYTTDDIGAVVFHLIDEGLLSKRAEDRRQDFESVLDLRERLEAPYFGKR